MNLSPAVAIIGSTNPFPLEPSVKSPDPASKPVLPPAPEYEHLMGFPTGGQAIVVE